MSNSSDIHIAASGLSKKFSRSLKRSFIYGAKDILRGIIHQPDGNALRPSEFWALQDISFKLHKGQSLGLVGLNGSGKTTLLRIISGILLPTRGTVSVNGRIAPMLALGAGFKPVLSGYENIFLNLSLLGVPQDIIRKQIPSIIDFADIEEALHAPLGTYSSGMRARLGFACAIHTDPQILVVDEVLAVGDTRFRMKCRNRMNALRKAGTSMLIVSHSAITLEALCDECLYLNKGQLISQGTPAKVLAQYEQASSEHTSQALISSPSEKPRPLTLLQLKNVTPLAGSPPADTRDWTSGDPGGLAIHTHSQTELADISINLMMFNAESPGDPIQLFTSLRDTGWLTLPAGENITKLLFPVIRLGTGCYRIKISISQGPKHDLLDTIDNIKIRVRGTKTSNCLFLQERTWELSSATLITQPDEINNHETTAEDIDDEV